MASQNFLNRFSARKRGRKAQLRTESWNQVGGIDSAIVNHSFANARTERHHPGGAGKSVTGAMVLKTIAAGILIGVTAKIRKNEQGGLVLVFRFALNGFPDFEAEAIGAADAINVKRVG